MPSFTLVQGPHTHAGNFPLQRRLWFTFRTKFNNTYAASRIVEAQFTSYFTYLFLLIVQ
jgi:hypothetical protein